MPARAGDKRDSMTKEEWKQISIRIINAHAMSGDAHELGSPDLYRQQFRQFAAPAFPQVSGPHAEVETALSTWGHLFVSPAKYRPTGPNGRVLAAEAIARTQRA